MRVSLALLGLIGFVFLLQLAIPGFTEFFYFNPAAPNPWMFVTSIFLHAGFSHIFFNGFALLIFGPYLESRIGAKRFLLVFFLSGIIGNVLYYATILLGIIPMIPALGASGAIYGVLGMLAVIAPELVIFVFYFPMPIRIAAGFWIVLEFLGSFNAASGIGSAAHLGGLLFGIAYGFFYLKKLKVGPDLEYYEEQDEKWDD